MIHRLGIVADDLTGAMDTGVQLVKWGLETVVMLGEGLAPKTEVLIISTDSREAAADEAYRRTAKAAKRLRQRTLYKKIDSTLRGNIGPELDAMVDSLGTVRVLVAPAFPALDRTTEDGYCRVEGVLLAESAFADDPLWPAKESHLPTLLRSQTSRTVGHIPLSTVACGEHAVAESLRANQAVLVTADAKQTAHLRTLARAIMLTGERWLLCGSAGLAEEWPAALGLTRPVQVVERWSLDERPAVVVAGSRHTTTVEQLRHVEKEGVVALVHLAAAAPNWPEVLEQVALPVLQCGRSVALTTTFSPYQTGQSDATSQILGWAAKWLVEHACVSGLILTGGDIARETCRALAAHGLRLLAEIQPGIPRSRLMGGAHDGLRVVAKGGGCGDKQALLQALMHIQGKI